MVETFCESYLFVPFSDHVSDPARHTQVKRCPVDALQGSNRNPRRVDSSKQVCGNPQLMAL